MNTVLFIVIFTIPGLLIYNLEKRFISSTKQKESDYIRRYNIFIDSTIIFIVSVLFKELIFRIYSLKILNDIKFDDFFLSGEDIKILVFYFSWVLVISGPYIWVKKILMKKIFLYSTNLFRKHKKLPIETEFYSVWDELFENKKMAIDNSQIIVIQKEDKIITQGYIKSYSPPNMEKREFLLENTSEIKMFLENDQNLSEEEKLLNVIDKEYYDTQSGINIKFINSDKLVGYLRSLKTD